MAVYIGHVLSTEAPKLCINSLKSVIVLPCRRTSCHAKVKKLPKRFIPNVPIQPKLDALSSRGFIRNVIPYEPPANASETLKKYFAEITGSDNLKHKLEDDSVYTLLSALNKEFSYSVPNSLLYKIKTLGDVYDFYTTPVECVVPYDKFKTMELPPNLHVIHDYIRFHPDSDTMFNGISAFPKSSTIVSGLKTRKKYKGFDAGNPFTDI